MDQLGAMRVFVAVGEARGFAAAARKLHMSPPAVTRSVAALEDHLGVTLLHRTTRTVRLSAAGSVYLADCRRILTELADADAAATGAHAAPRGELSVTAPLQFGRLHVAPLLFDFMRRYPAISARMLFVDRLVDLVDEGVDVAVRIGELPDSTLSAARVGTMRRVLCASPSYLRRRGVPRSPRDLRAHDVISFSALPSSSLWTFSDGTVIHPAPRVVANTADVVVAAAVAGHGIARVLAYQVEDDVATRKLQVLLPGFELPPVPVHLVHHIGRHPSARARLFIDFARKRLARKLSGPLLATLP
jgi:DNA-binding transcriptional LysR family regulator